MLESGIRRTVWAVLAAVIFLLPVSLSAATSHNQGEHGFAITLPDDWCRIPQKILNEKNRELIRENQELFYDLAFQLENREWFEFPYILIRVNEENRVPKGNIDKINQAVVDNMKEADKSDRYDVTILEQKEYPDRNMFLVRSDFKSKDKWDIRIDFAQIYTQKGVLQFSYYGSRQNATASEPDYIRAVENLNLDPEMVYRENFSDKLSLSNWVDSLGGVLALSLGIGLLLIVIFYFALKRKKS